jgi:2-C-methyl-D-erythritol 4-phosphate cytidylyltransferase / 2-C-methyl-D-erythritol 2,4-cyclodiphosphate synthase
MPTADAVVVAAGRSARMAGVDKLEATIGGRPLLAWTVDAIARANAVERVVVVAAPERVAAIRSARWLPAKVVAVVAGGGRRQESVHAGVATLLEHGTSDPRRVLLVHDGARPLVSPALVEAVAMAAAEHGAAIPVVPVGETLKRIVDGQVIETIGRDGLAAAQTPQGVRLDLLLAAWAEQPPDGAATFTDEASLLEACRIAVHAIPGDVTNLKVTLPDDLRRAERGLPRTVRVRTGFGEDGHPFGPGDGLVLGGVTFDGAPRLHGHSDGDVALHALADALLGAAGLGDLGRLFPADERTPRGVSSAGLLEEVARRLDAAGFRVLNVDLTIIGSRPRLGPRLDEIRAEVARLLGLSEEAVAVKASSGNLGGAEGAGRAIAARAVATVEAATS